MILQQLLKGIHPGRPPAPSQGEQAEAGIVLRLALSGNLRGAMNATGDNIEFTSPGGVVVMQYGHLTAFDATGREVPVSMALNETGIDILLDAHIAVYPLTVDPMVSSPPWTAESDQSGAYFGVSVSTAGDVNGDGFADVIVGACY